MKFIAAAVVLVLLIIAGVATAFLKLDLNAHKPTLEAYIAKAAGLPSARIDGPITFKAYPELTLGVEKVTLAGHYGEEPLAIFEGLNIKLTWQGLFKLGITPTLIQAQNITIALKQFDDTTTNYQPKRQARKFRSSAPKSLYPLTTLGHVHIAHFTLTQEDVLQNTIKTFIAENLQIDSTQGLDATNLNAQVTYTTVPQPFVVSATADLRSLREIPFLITTQQTKNQFIAKGTLFDPFTTPSFKGLLSAQIEDMSIVPPQWQNRTAPVKELVAILEGHFSEQHINLTQFTLEATPEEAGATQSIKGSALFEKQKGQEPHQLTLKAQAENITIAPTPSGTEKPKKHKQWSEAPFDLQFLKGFTLNIDLQAQNSHFFGRFFPSISLNASNTQSHFRIHNAALTDGAGYLKLEGSYAHALTNPQLSADITAKNLNIETLLTPAEKKYFNGTLNAQSRLTAQGATQKDLIESLDGQGMLEVRNGRLPVLKFATALTVFRQLFKGAPQTGSDGFSNAQLTFTFEDGTFTTKDLAITAENFTITGQAKVDLGKWAINARLYPEIKTGFAEASVPLHISGNLSTPIITPIANSSATKGAAIGTLLGGPVGASVGAGVGAILGGTILKDAPKQPTTPQPEEKKKLPFDLNNLVPQDVRNFLNGKE